MLSTPKTPGNVCMRIPLALSHPLPSPASAVLLKLLRVGLSRSHHHCLSIDTLLRFGTRMKMMKMTKRNGTWKDTRMRTQIWRTNRLKWKASCIRWNLMTE